MSEITALAAVKATSLLISGNLTDEQITRILQSQGIQVTRRTVAKYREDMKIPSTHQRRVKKVIGPSGDRAIGSSKVKGI